MRAGTLDGARLARGPRGYRADHPAAEYLRYQQFFAGRQFPADLACSPRFYPTLLRTFRALAPLVTFLNTPLRARQAAGDLRASGSNALGFSAPVGTPAA